MKRIIVSSRALAEKLNEALEGMTPDENGRLSMRVEENAIYICGKFLMECESRSYYWYELYDIVKLKKLVIVLLHIPEQPVVVAFLQSSIHLENIEI